MNVMNEQCSITFLCHLTKNDFALLYARRQAEYGQICFAVTSVVDPQGIAHRVSSAHCVLRGHGGNTLQAASHLRKKSLLVLCWYLCVFGCRRLGGLFHRGHQRSRQWILRDRLMLVAEDYA